MNLDWQTESQEVKRNPIQGRSGAAVATYDIESNRISRIELENMSSKDLEQITKAVNAALDSSDRLWDEFSNELRNP